MGWDGSKGDHFAHLSSNNLHANTHGNTWAKISLALDRTVEITRGGEGRREGEGWRGGEVEGEEWRRGGGGGGVEGRRGRGEEGWRGRRGMRG